MAEEPNNIKRGKIARLPEAIREQVCRKMADGEPGSKILPWLNELPQVIKILSEDFEGLRINDQNLSAWRSTGFAEWMKRRERVERTKELARYAADQAKANGASIAEGAASVASGKILELLETVDDASGNALDVESLVKVTTALASLRTTEQNEVRLSQNERRLSQKDEMIVLERERFQRDTCKLFLKWATEKRALDLANSDGSMTEKIEALGQLMFPETWKAEEQKVEQPKA